MVNVNDMILVQNGTPQDTRSIYERLEQIEKDIFFLRESEERRIEESKPKYETYEEQQQRILDRYPSKTNIICNVIGCEGFYIIQKNYILASSPPKFDGKCEKCGDEQYIYE